MRLGRHVWFLGTILLEIWLVAAVFAAWLFADLIRRADEGIEKGGTIGAEVSAVRHWGYGIWGGQEIEARNAERAAAAGHDYDSLLAEVQKAYKKGKRKP